MNLPSIAPAFACQGRHADELLIEVFREFLMLSKLNLRTIKALLMADILTALVLGF